MYSGASEEQYVPVVGGGLAGGLAGGQLDGAAAAHAVAGAAFDALRELLMCVN